MLGVSSLKHRIPRTRVLVPTAKGFRVHWTEFPLSQRVLDARLKSAFLLVFTYFKPVFDEHDAPVYDILFYDWAQFQEAGVLVLTTKAHYALNTCAVIPATVKDHDLSGRRKVVHVALYIHLRLFPIRRRRQCDQPENPRADALGHCPNRASLTRGIPPFKDDDDPETFVFDPILQFAEFRLQPTHLLLIFLTLQAAFF